MGMSLLDNVVGCLLAATWVNAATFGIEVLLTYNYFTHYNDPWNTKIQVIIGNVVGLVLMFDQFAVVWLYAITNWGNAAYLARQSVPIAVYVFCTAILGANSQAFLILRASKLIKNMAARMLVICVLGGAALASAAGACWSGIIVLAYPSYDDRLRLFDPVTVWLAISAAADAAIACTLVGLLLWMQNEHNMRSGVSLKPGSAVVSRIVRRTVETGSATAVLAVVAFIVFKTLPTSNICVAIAYQLGRFYTLSILVALNMRDSARGAGTSTPAAGHSKTVWSRAGGRNGTASDAYGMSGIAVTHTVHVEEDNELGQMPSRSKLEKVSERDDEQKTYHVNIARDAYNLKAT